MYIFYNKIYTYVEVFLKLEPKIYFRSFIKSLYIENHKKSEFT